MRSLGSVAVGEVCTASTFSQDRAVSGSIFSEGQVAFWILGTQFSLTREVLHQGEDCLVRIETFA